MFGTNSVVGRKFFETQAPDARTLMVASIFHTLQGEGPLAGRPAIFVRLAKCQLRCSFCDTFFEKGSWMDPDSIMAKALTLAAHGTPLRVSESPLSKLALIVTGGEPMLQTRLVNLLDIAVKEFSVVQIESNGLLYLEIPDSVYLVVSPKCAETPTKGATHYLKPGGNVLGRANCLKFVMNANPYSPYNTVPTWAFDWHLKTGRPIYVSPMNEYARLPWRSADAQGTMEQRSAAERISFWEEGLLDMNKIRDNHEYAAQYCLDHGLFLTMQMQLFTSLA